MADKELPRGSKPAGGPVDPQLKALIDDLEESIGRFDDSVIYRQPEPTPPPLAAIARSGMDFPTLDPNVVRSLQASPGVGKEQAPERTTPTAGLLGQLASAAHQKSDALAKAAVSDLSQRQNMDRCLRRVFDYVHQLSQHLEVLRPEIPQPFALSRDLVFRNVVWQDSSTDFRTEMQAGQSLFHTVVLRARLLAGAPLRLACPDKKLDAFKNDLAFLNIHIDEESMPGPNGMIALRLSPEIPCQLHFAADLKAGAVVLRARNVGGLGLNAFVTSPNALDQGVLDELGLCLLGRSRDWPAALKSVPFKPIG